MIAQLPLAVLLNIAGILADLSAIQRRIMAVQDAPMRATVHFETMPDGNALAFTLRVEIDLGGKHADQEAGRAGTAPGA